MSQRLIIVCYWLVSASGFTVSYTFVESFDILILDDVIGLKTEILHSPSRASQKLAAAFIVSASSCCWSALTLDSFSGGAPRLM